MKVRQYIPTRLCAFKYSASRAENLGPEISRTEYFYLIGRAKMLGKKKKASYPALLPGLRPIYLQGA